MRVSTLLPAAALAAPSMAAVLYATTYDGFVHTLTLTGSTLTNTSIATGCGAGTGGAGPSWLTRTPDALFCSNEGAPGTLSTYTATAEGVLTPGASVGTTGGDVSNALYGNGAYIAVAHYGQGSVSTYALPLTDGAEPLLNLTFPRVGDRATAPHQIVTDPSGAFLLVPDLTADLVRVFGVDAASGGLNPLEDIQGGAGSGPRHAAFYQNAQGTTYMYLTSELASTLSGYRMTVANGVPSFERVVEPFRTAPEGSPGTPGDNGARVNYISEVMVSGNTVTVSNRGDQSFGTETDSLSVYTIAEDGSLSMVGHYSAGGNWPRTFDINSAGDMVVVGNQRSQSAVVMRRDTSTGALGEVVATYEFDAVLSSVIWGCQSEAM